MAADGGFGGGVARGGGSNAKEEGGEELGRDAWSSLAAGGGSGAAQRCRRAALSVGGEREQRGRQGKEKRDCLAISKISRELNVKQG